MRTAIITATLFMLMMSIVFQAMIAPQRAQAEPVGRSYYEPRGDVVWEVPGQEKVVALTFDDGPDRKDTVQILDLLKKYNAKATFFVMGRKALEHPEIIQRAVREQHELANHTYTHRILNRSCTEEQIRKEIVDTQKAIYSVTGINTQLFRPPGGIFTSKVLAISKNEGLQMVLWSWHQDTHDWSRPGVNRIVRKVLGNIRNGDIVLLHDFVDGQTQTVEALQQILPELTKRGYRFVTVSELLSHNKQVTK